MTFPHLSFTIGQQVPIKLGAMRGFEGPVVEVFRAPPLCSGFGWSLGGGEERIIMCTMIRGHACPVELDACMVEVVPTTES